MKVIELLKIGRETLKTLQESCVKMDDYRFIPLYDEYVKIVGGGGKTSFAVALLAEKYAISERKVYYLINRFNSDCKIGAVG